MYEEFQRTGKVVSGGDVFPPGTILLIDSLKFIHIPTVQSAIEPIAVVQNGEHAGRKIRIKFLGEIIGRANHRGNNVLVYGVGGSELKRMND